MASASSALFGCPKGYQSLLRGTNHSILEALEPPWHRVSSNEGTSSGSYPTTLPILAFTLHASHVRLVRLRTKHLQGITDFEDMVVTVASGLQGNNIVLQIVAAS